LQGKINLKSDSILFQQDEHFLFSKTLASSLPDSSPILSPSSPSLFPFALCFSEMVGPEGDRLGIIEALGVDGTSGLEAEGAPDIAAIISVAFASWACRSATRAYNILRDVGRGYYLQWCGMI